MKVVNNQMDVLKAGKRTISLDLKKPRSIEIMRKLCKNSGINLHLLN